MTYNDYLKSAAAETTVIEYLFNKAAHTLFIVVVLLAWAHKIVVPWPLALAAMLVYNLGGKGASGYLKPESLRDVGERRDIVQDSVWGGFALTLSAVTQIGYTAGIVATVVWVGLVWSMGVNRWGRP